jgi:hypothetical protein
MNNILPAFDRFIGIDYSGAQTLISSLKGLRVFQAERTIAPVEALPLPIGMKNLPVFLIKSVRIYQKTWLSYFF